MLIVESGGPKLNLKIFFFYVHYIDFGRKRIYILIIGLN